MNDDDANTMWGCGIYGLYWSKRNSPARGSRSQLLRWYAKMPPRFNFLLNILVRTRNCSVADPSGSLTKLACQENTNRLVPHDVGWWRRLNRKTKDDVEQLSKGYPLLHHTSSSSASSWFVAACFYLPEAGGLGNRSRGNHLPDGSTTTTTMMIEMKSTIIFHYNRVPMTM